MVEKATTKKTAAKKAAPAERIRAVEDKPEQTWIITPEGKRVKSEDYEG